MGCVQVEVEETISVAVNDPVAQPADLMKLQELLTNGAEGVKAGERVVTREVRGPCPRNEVAELPWEWFDLPGSAEKVIVQESHDLRCVASNEEVAMEAKGGDAREDFHSTYGGTAETAGDPMNHKILDACHMLEVFEGASPIERVPKWQPIGEYWDHAGVVAQDMLSGPRPPHEFPSMLNACIVLKPLLV